MCEIPVFCSSSSYIFGWICNKLFWLFWLVRIPLFRLPHYLVYCLSGYGKRCACIGRGLYVELILKYVINFILILVCSLIILQKIVLKHFCFHIYSFLILFISFMFLICGNVWLLFNACTGYIRFITLDYLKCYCIF